MAATRHSGLECLRIISIILIVSMHILGNTFHTSYNPQNEMFRLLGTKRSFSQNETFFFSHPYPPTLPFSA